MKKIAIIGGGAAGMSCAVLLAKKGLDVTLLERGERLGRKLSATGNGQGNVTNTDMRVERYFSDDLEKVGRILSRFGSDDAVRFLEGLGGVFLPDARGRVYPASRQASAVTDLFRRELMRRHVNIVCSAQVHSLTFDRDFRLAWAGGHMNADAVVLASGGKAAKNFGTDGTAYVLAEGFGHTVTPLSPALVQLRSEPQRVRGLKGIRVDGGLTLKRNGEKTFEGRGDILFTESGISGDLAFRASSYAREGDLAVIDFLPDVSLGRLSNLPKEDALLCVVHNGLARVLEREANGDRARLLQLVKGFSLPITGTLGFDYAQVTKGGIPLGETDEHLMSKFQKGLYFAGEILNVDGECGGYNLHWAFASAHAVSEDIEC